MLRRGISSFNLWTEEANPFGTLTQNSVAEIVVSVYFKDHGQPVEFPPRRDYFSSKFGSFLWSELTVSEQNRDKNPASESPYVVAPEDLKKIESIATQGNK
jgi:hypothetical protein